MPTGLLSLGATLSYSASGGTFTVLSGLQEIPEIGGTPEKVEVTTLADDTKRYINGIKDFGDLAFTFLYDNADATASFRVLQGLEVAGDAIEFKVTYPDSTEFTFSALPSVTMGGATVNGALTFTLNLALNSSVAIKHPSAGVFAAVKASDK